MFCCRNCFIDPVLRIHIADKGNEGNCSFCGSEKASCLLPEELNHLFLPLINLYSPIENFTKPEKQRDYHERHLWEKIQDDWNIFHTNTQASRYELFKRIITKQLEAGERQLLTSYYDRESDFYGIENEEVNQLESEWTEFTEELKLRNRFFPSIQFDLNHLEYLLQHLDTKIDANTIFYRSRIAEHKKRLFPREMGKPPGSKAKNGRANPIGIPYLYIASSLKTAIAEVRPIICDAVTIGRFKNIKPLSIIDLRHISPFRFFESEDFEELVYKIGYLKILGDDLSLPVNPRDSHLDYLPTQYICEFIKNKGWDGVAYKSSVGDGHNLAIFSDEKLKCIGTKLYKIEKTEFAFNEC